MRRPQTIDHLNASDLYASLDPHRSRAEAPGRRLRFNRLWALASAVIVVAFAGGVALDAAVLHIGDHHPSTSVVIGQKVIREDPPARTAPRQSTPNDAPSLSWTAPVLADPAGSIRSISCTSSSFCVAVDGHGQAVVYAAGQWTAARDVDGSTQLNSVSCTSASWCVAVDQAGNTLFYNGVGWTSPERIDSSPFPELTSVSCSSASFCAAVDGHGDALIYNGTRWSPPQGQEVDVPGWNGAESRDVPSVSCPSDGSCVGVDPENDAFFYQGTSWQPAQAIDPSSGTPAIKSPNGISCASATFCVATDNLGDIEAYNGTQWSLPVTVDPNNYLVTISCPSASFCVGVDSVLPAGFNSGSAGGSGQVVIYNGITWSEPHQVDPTGLVSSISCTSAQFCAAADGSGDVVIGTAPSTSRRS